MSVASILGPQGLIAQRLKTYEVRPQQLDMAQAVAQAFADKHHLMAEAGTGVGKSFAYLVPAILAASADKNYRVVISTHTISLQEQIVGRDIPFLNSVLPIEFSAVLVKGRGNYISLRRLKGAHSRAQSMFSRPEEVEQIDRIGTWSNVTTDGSRATLDFVKATAKGPVKMGFSAMAIPLSRGEMDYAMGLSKTMGMDPVDEEVIPPPTADYTPFATKLNDSGPNWVYSWAPWVTQVRTLEALRKLGWQDDYIAWGHLEAESELARLKDGKFYVVNSNALFQEKQPIHQEIEAAADKAGSKFPAQTMTEGWIGGMAIEAALKAAGWPADPAKLRAAMENLTIDTKGLRGGPIVWTKDNHFRTQLYYRVYKWDGDKIARVQDWKTYEVK